jgi:hypothetical protein
VNTESTLPPPPASKGRDPWKIFGVITIVLVVVGGAVGVGFVLGKDTSSGDAEPTGTLPEDADAPTTTLRAQPTTTLRAQPTTTTISRVPAGTSGLYDNDGRLSDSEHDEFLDVALELGVPSDAFVSISDKDRMENYGVGVCSMLDRYGAFDPTEAQWKQEFAEANNTSSIDPKVDVLFTATIFAAGFMCLDFLIAANER